MTTLTRVVFAKEDMSTDNQEDSSADPEVLNKSKETAARQEKVNLGESIDAAEGESLTPAIETPLPVEVFPSLVYLNVSLDALGSFQPQ